MDTKFQSTAVQNIFNLGNDTKTNDPVEAVDKFMEREFEEILKHDTDPHPTIFIPEFHLYHCFPYVMKYFHLSK